MPRTAPAGLALSLLLWFLGPVAIATPQTTTSPTYSFWLVGSDLETHSPAAIIGLARVVPGNQVTGKATVNDGGKICNARIGGMVKPTPEGTADAFITMSAESGACPSPLEFRGVISNSGKVFSAIEVDSKMVTAGAAWVQ
ncbi:MAG TPA: hypothetical protein VMH37_17660 [Candidatus Binataceae bacterium]|nr:hypothetical protein [Candidatus Binataceae bacterium]